MSRGKSRKAHQAEKILVLLLNAPEGHLVSVEEITSTLGAEIKLYRLPSYLWDLKKMGAEVKKTKNGRKIIGFTLVNHEAMLKYSQERGLIAPDPIQLSSNDLVA